MIMVVFQSVFRSKIHRNNIFLKKKLFLTSTHQNDQKTPKTLLESNKNFKFSHKYSITVKTNTT
jgi:hypothetical protein